MPDVDENDPTILALRESARAVDLHGHASEVRGEYAFPMISRGALVGVLVCGAKRDGDAYAPDERDALEEVAQNVGTSLDAVAGGGVESAILGLQDQFAALRSEIRELIAALRPNPSAKPEVAERE
jgi:GAF domain-containing protein